MLSIQDVYTPASLDEALELLQKPGIKPIAAGTDILPAARDGLLTGLSLLDLTPLKDALSYIRFENGCLKIGALTTHTAIAANPLVKENAPVLASACGQIGSVQIRNRATLGGNVVHASPAADSVPFLVAAGASIVIKTSDGTSEMPIADFLVGPRKTMLPDGGLVTEICVPVPDGGWQGVYHKVGGRTSLTIAIVSVAVLKSGDDWRAAYGSMSAKIARCTPVEAFLASGAADDKRAVADIVKKTLKPISDVRASSVYRLELASNLTWLSYHELNNPGQ